MNREIVTIGELARIFGVTKPTIRKWVDSIPGFIQPFTPEGCQMKFWRHEVESYLHRNEASR